MSQAPVGQPLGAQAECRQTSSSLAMNARSSAIADVEILARLVAGR